MSYCSYFALFAGSKTSLSIEKSSSRRSFARFRWLLRTHKRIGSYSDFISRFSLSTVPSFLISGWESLGCIRISKIISKVLPNPIVSQRTPPFRTTTFGIKFRVNTAVHGDINNVESGGQIENKGWRVGLDGEEESGRLPSRFNIHESAKIWWGKGSDWTKEGIEAETKATVESGIECMERQEYRKESSEPRLSSLSISSTELSSSCFKPSSVSIAEFVVSFWSAAVLLWALSEPSIILSTWLILTLLDTDEAESETDGYSWG